MTMRFRMHTDSVEATMSAGKALGSLVSAGDVVLLSGDLGAGKTQLTKGLAEGLGVVDPVTSPTFNILLVHEGRIPLYHMDLYRLDTAEQLLDIDYDATLEADGVSVVEWGDRFEEAQPLDGIAVVIAIEDDEVRCVEVRTFGPRGESLAGAWSSACESVPGVSVEVRP